MSSPVSSSDAKKQEHPSNIPQKPPQGQGGGQQMSREKILELQLQKERAMRASLQNRIQYQQQQIFNQAHPKPAFTVGQSAKKPSKKEKKFTFRIVVSQVAPQADGHIHVTAGYKLSGFIVLKVKTDESPFFMSALSLSLRQKEEVLLGDAEGRTKKKILKSLMFPVAEHFKDSTNQPSERGFFSWSRGVYRFPFVVETYTEYLPTYSYYQEEPFVEVAKRSYFLDVHYRKSVSDNEPWQLCHNTEIHIHQFRKLPPIIEYSKKQNPSSTKNSSFILRKGEISSTIKLPEQKTVYFMCFDNLPVSLEINNQAGFSVKRIYLRFCQDLMFRTSTKGKAMLMKTLILWEKDLAEKIVLPLAKKSSASVNRVIIPLNFGHIAPTSVKSQKTLFYLHHYIELVIKTPAQVSDISHKLPVTICEPPVEHLAQALYNRKQAQAKAAQAAMMQKRGQGNPNARLQQPGNKPSQPSSTPQVNPSDAVEVKQDSSSSEDGSHEETGPLVKEKSKEF